MNTIELLNHETPLKSETPEIRRLVERLCTSLCANYSINPLSQELIFHFGHLSDENNQQAICTWVHQELLLCDVPDQAALLEDLNQKFERKLDSLWTAH